MSSYDQASYTPSYLEQRGRARAEAIARADTVALWMICIMIAMAIAIAIACSLHHLIRPSLESVQEQIQIDEIREAARVRKAAWARKYHTCPLCSLEYRNATDTEIDEETKENQSTSGSSMV